MSKVEKYEVSVTDEDGTTNIYPVLPSTTTLYSNDEEYSIKLVVGKEYTVAVRSENSVGASEGVSTSFGKYNGPTCFHVACMNKIALLIRVYFLVFCKINLYFYSLSCPVATISKHNLTP